MRTRAKLAPWASKVFERRIGNLDVDVPPSVEAIKNGNRGRFDVVFVRSPGWHDPSDRVTALDYLYDMEQLVPFGGPPAMNSRASTLDAEVRKVGTFSPKQLRIAATAFSESRFLRDPLLSMKAPAMYTRWLYENRAYVLSDSPDDGFLIATKDSDGARRISLMAVSEEKRGGGIGELLALNVLSERSPEIWRVKASVRNYRAVRFYESIGFHVKSVWTAFHVWIGRNW